MNALYDALLRQVSTPPSVVADKIVEIVQTGSWKLRHVTTADAEGILQYRVALTDKQWIDFRAVESDQGICRDDQA